MRRVDPTLELVACGSSNRHMPTGRGAQAEREANHLVLDEWDVWYQQNFPGELGLDVREVSPLIEDTYTVDDAVMVGSLLITPAPACRPGEDRLPGATGERDRPDPDRARRRRLPVDGTGICIAALPPASWHLIRLALAGKP
jgi:hypothetical protein